MISNVHLTKDGGVPFNDLEIYNCSFVKLNYCTVTHMYISFRVSSFKKFMFAPKIYNILDNYMSSEESNKSLIMYIGDTYAFECPILRNVGHNIKNWL